MNTEILDPPALGLHLAKIYITGYLTVTEPFRRLGWLPYYPDWLWTASSRINQLEF